MAASPACACCMACASRLMPSSPSTASASRPPWAFSGQFGYARQLGSAADPRRGGTGTAVAGGGLRGEIRGPRPLPARREDIELRTEDDLRPSANWHSRRPGIPSPPRHPAPAPTAGGFMDSHILRKAAARLPALADLAVLRFNSRGTSRRAGGATAPSTGEMPSGTTWPRPWTSSSRGGLPRPYRGLAVRTAALKYGRSTDIEASSSPRRRCTGPPRRRSRPGRMTSDGSVLVPELDDYLRPAEAVALFAASPHALPSR